MAIVLLGAGIDGLLLARGFETVIVMAIAIIVAIAVANYIGRLVKLPRRAATLVGVGTAICGASAIAGVAPILKSKKDEIGLALRTIFTFNAIAPLVYPLRGTLLQLSDNALGTRVGIGVHDTATSVATRFAFSESAGEIATVVKLARTLFLIPLIIFLTQTTQNLCANLKGSALRETAEGGMK